jgi:hypothetical protein
MTIGHRVRIGGKYLDCMIMVGKKNDRTGAITVYGYGLRPARDGDACVNGYGLARVWTPAVAKGEEVLHLERLAQIGVAVQPASAAPTPEAAHA